MKFGKDFRNHLEETLPAWRDKYLAYKALKKLIKNLRPPDPAAAAALPLPPPPAAEVAGSGAAAQGNVAALGNWFASILDMELHKLNDFYMEREEWYVIRLQVLKERIERVKAKKNDAFTSKSEFTEEMLEIPMKAIQGLRRASSTYNPLSLSRFFNGEDGEPCSGAITSESSLSDSSTDSQIQDADKDGKEVQSNSREQNAAQRGHNAEGEPRDE
nr:unnamed protein product [Digitaria exilis]